MPAIIDSDEGGDPACWVHLLCPDCGRVLDASHRDGCPPPVRDVPGAVSRPEPGRR